MEQVIYRPMERGDIERILANFPYSIDKQRKLLESYFDDQERGLRTVVVADQGGEVAGYVMLLPSASIGAFRKKNVPAIFGLTVFDKFRRQGIGTELMNRIEEAAAKVSDTVCLGVGVHSGDGAAQRLFIKRGYVPDGSGVWCGRQPARPFDTVESVSVLVLYMSKQIR